MGFLRFPYGFEYGAPLGGPSGRRTSAISAVAIPTAPVRRLVVMSHTGVRRFHRVSL